MTRRLLTTSGLGLTLVLLVGGAAGAQPPSPPTTSATLTTSGTSLLLPGAQTWADGASSYDFGTNDSIEYSSQNVDTLPSVQTDLKDGGLTLMRTWGYDSDSDSSIRQRLATIEHTGMHCMFVLGSTNDLSWMKHVVSMLGSGCNLYEFGNEPDNAGSIAGNIKGATSEWIADVPALRAINPHALFGGPALTWSSSADGSQGSYPSDMAYFLAKTAAANERADFISYHDYPCTKATSMAQCISMTPGDFQWNWDQVIGWENEYYGRAITTGISEYNFDPGTANLDAWGHNGPFMYEWTRTAVNAVAGLHMAFANQYDSLNYGGYGYLDMFSDSAPYGPKPQFNAMASEVRDYDPLSTKVLVPSNGATLSGSAVLDASVTAPGSVTAVTFDLSGGSLPTQMFVATAVDTLFGWIAKWNTASVANGTYRLQSVVTETGGSTASSPKVSITVSNKG